MAKSEDGIDNVGIYCIENITTKKKYIGKSINIRKRINFHKSSLRNNSHKNKFLQNAWNKYGENDFIFYVLVNCQQDQCFVLEKYYIQKFKSFNSNKGYNLSLGGDGPGTMCESTKRKISSSLVGRVFSNETKRKISSGVRKAQNKEYREKLSASLVGHKLREETKDKISKAHKGKKKPWVSEQNRNRVTSEYARQRASETHKGKPKSKEQKEKMSESAKRWRAELKNLEVIDE